MAEEEQKFKKYCQQLEKYGQTESVHSPVMAMLRRKARKQLLTLMKQEKTDCTSHINKLWIVGYYHPFQFFTRESEKIMETTTLLTLFCGELQEMLFLNSDEKYGSLWNLYIGDLHRYMPDGDVQKLLSASFYTRSIELDRRHGRAFHLLSTTKTTISQKIRLMILGQLTDIPYKKRSELTDFLKNSDENSDFSENLCIKFTNWALNDTQNRVEHQKKGAEIQMEIEKNEQFLEILSICRLAAKLAFRERGYNQFISCFDVISNLFLSIFSKSKISAKKIIWEAISWILDVGKVFESMDPIKNEPYFQNLSIFVKTKWNELNDLVMIHINNEFSTDIFLITPSFSDIDFLINGPKSDPSDQLIAHLISELISMKYPTMEKNEEKGEEGILRRINQIVQKRLDIPLEALMEKLTNREDWRPIYVQMDFETIIEKAWIAKKIWDIDDFICILPSDVLEKLDAQKTKNKNIRPVIRSLMEFQAKGKIVLKKCVNERECAERLVESVQKSSDHKNIVAFLCPNPEEQEPMDGVTFYEIEDFYKKYLE